MKKNGAARSATTIRLRNEMESARRTLIPIKAWSAACLLSKSRDPQPAVVLGPHLLKL